MQVTVQLLRFLHDDFDASKESRQSVAGRPIAEL